jgi:hypothetical protein
MRWAELVEIVRVGVRHTWGYQQYQRRGLAQERRKGEGRLDNRNNQIDGGTRYNLDRISNRRIATGSITYEE